MHNNLAIIGASYLQLPLILKAKEMGFITHVFAWKADDVGEKVADYFHPISTIEKELITEKCREIGIQGICSIATDIGNVTVNYVANQLGLTCNTMESTYKSTNKYLMRQAFEEHGDPSPKSILIDGSTDLLSLNFMYPIIVKPTDRSGSRGVCKIENQAELYAAIKSAISDSFEKKAVIEEFVEGQEYSVEGISFNGVHHILAVTLKYTTGAPHFIETGHLEPAPLDSETYSRIVDVVTHALNSLEIKNGASHSEIKIDRDGNIKIIEIGARMGGDCIGSDLVYYSTGIDYMKTVIQVACGQEPDLSIIREPISVEVRFLLTQDDVQKMERLQKTDRFIKLVAFSPENIGHTTDSSNRAGCYIVKRLPDLNGKRLLVLGGSAWSNIIKEFTNENNITVITAGNDPNSPIAQLGEYHNINSIDAHTMKDFIKASRIDGVYMGSNETVIRHALQYLNELNMPCYCSLQQWDALMNKKNFKRLCELLELPVAKAYSYVPDNPCTVNYPLVTKPADGCASVGVSICNNEEELLKGYEFALESSPSHEVLVEQCVNNSGMDVFFQITDGSAEFCALGDKYPVQLQIGAGSVAGARVLPSKYTEEFRQRFEGKLKKLFKHVGLYQGLIWMEVFHDGDQYYFNEVGYRPNGSLSIIGIDYLCDINTVASDIYYALTGKSRSHGFSSLILKNVSKNKKNVCEYWIASKHGTVGKIEGIEELRDHPNILAVFPKYDVGSTIPHTNGFAQNFCVVHFAYDNTEEMREVINYIRQNVKLSDQVGYDMIIHKSDAFIENLISSQQKSKDMVC